MKALLTALLIVGLIGMSHSAFASDKKAIQDTGEQVRAEMVENVEYVGFVDKTETGYTLQVGLKSFLLEGENLEKFVGKTVEIIGQLVKGNEIDTIFVVQLKLAE